MSTYNNVCIVLDSSGSWKGKNTLNMKFVIRGMFWGESKGGGKLFGGEPWEGKGAKLRSRDSMRKEIGIGY